MPGLDNEAGDFWFDIDLNDKHVGWGS